MWTFLDDFADSTGLRKTKLIRLAVCIVLVVLCIFFALSAFAEKQAQDVALAEGNNTLVETRLAIEDKQRELNELQAQTGAVEYEPVYVCDGIAQLQNEYGNNTMSMSVEAVAQKTAQVMDGLTEFLYGDTPKTAWFDAQQEKFSWVAMNAQTNSIEKVTPILWECRDANGTLLAITTGTYNGEQDRAGDFRTYLTLDGQRRLNSGDMDQAGQQVSQLQQQAQQNAANIQYITGMLPSGFTDEDRANTGDGSFDGTNPVLSSVETTFRATLSAADAPLFDNLNHAARGQFMLAHGFDPTTAGGDTGTNPSSGTTSQPSSSGGAAGTKPMTNDDVVRSALSN